MISISVPTVMSPDNIRTWLDEWSNVPSGQALRVDLSSCIFITPGGVTILAACLRSRKDAHLETFLRGNPDSEVFRYLQRMDFFDRLNLSIEEKFVRHAPDNRFVPLQSIDSEQSSRSTATRITEFIHAQFPELPTSVGSFTRFILDELGANIVQHAQAGTTGFCHAQAYRNKGFIEYSFADYGIGIRNSLLENLEYRGRITSDDEAILLAMEDRVSRTQDSRRNMGVGLFEFNRMCRRMDAEMWILSGNATIHRKHLGGECLLEKIQIVPNYHGTWICFRAPLSIQHTPGTGL